MTTLRDLLADFLEEYKKRLDEVNRITLDDDLPDATEDMENDLIDEYIDAIVNRWVG